MKKILIAVGVVGVSLFFIAHKKTTTQAQVRPVYLPEEDVEPHSQRTFQRHVASIQDLQKKLNEVSKKQQPIKINPTASSGVFNKKKELPTQISAPVQVVQQKNPQAASARASAQKLYDPSDLELLHKAAERAREEGSRVAYIGEVQDLYAFSPQFFETYKDENGQPAIRIRQVHSMDRVRSPAGESKMLVQREPYPVPSTKNYDLVTRAIMKAIDDGATVVNIASSQIDRTQLTDAIHYARSRGVPVITVPPPQN